MAINAAPLRRAPRKDLEGPALPPRGRKPRGQGWGAWEWGAALGLPGRNDCVCVIAIQRPSAAAGGRPWPSRGLPHTRRARSSHIDRARMEEPMRARAGEASLGLLPVVPLVSAPSLPSGPAESGPPPGQGATVALVVFADGARSAPLYATRQLLTVGIYPQAGGDPRSSPSSPLPPSVCSQEGWPEAGLEETQQGLRAASLRNHLFLS